ncbi:MAG: outer membrane protein transport protein [Crocinitomicaceae bacterium]
MRNFFTLILLLPFIGFSQGFQVNFQGQQQQGMGGAGSALPQDAAILFFNPGAASFHNSNEISVAMTPTFAKGTFLEDNTNETAHTTSPVGTPFSAYGLFQIKEDSKLKLGLAVYTPFGSTVEWEEGWTGRFALTRLKLLSIFVQPTISYRLTKKIGIGAGFVYSYGKVNLQKDLPLQDVSGEYGHAELSGSGNGFGFNVGLYIEPTEHLNFAVTYRSQVNMNLKKGEADFSVPESLNDKFPDGRFTSSIPLPSVFTFGIAVKPSEKLAIALDANYVNWKAYDTLAFDYETNTSSLLDTKSARKYEGSIAVRLGAQYKVTPQIIARLGIAYAMTPVQNGYVTPETPDNNRINYTCGIGYTITEKLILDASFLFTQVKREDTNLETGLSGKFKTLVFAPGLAVTYKL